MKHRAVVIADPGPGLYLTSLRPIRASLQDTPTQHPDLDTGGSVCIGFVEWITNPIRNPADLCGLINCCLSARTRVTTTIFNYFQIPAAL